MFSGIGNSFNTVFLSEKKQNQLSSLSFGRKPPALRRQAVRDEFIRQQPTETITSSTNDIKQVEYKNIFTTPLKAQPNPDLINRLSNDSTIYDPKVAALRIKNLSRYLKEEMVGFITPGGKQWFEGACTYIIKATAGTDMNDETFKKLALPAAKDFWNLMALADPYWTSGEFEKYLKTLEQNPGIVATIKAIEEIKNHKPPSGKDISFGYSSDMRFIQKILDGGCAYTGVPLKLDREANNQRYPSLEHILPHIIGGDEVNDDCNYLLVTPDANSERSNLPLTIYLKGWSHSEFTAAYNSWEDAIDKFIERDKLYVLTISTLNKKERGLLNQYYNKMIKGSRLNFDKLSRRVKLELKRLIVDDPSIDPRYVKLLSV